MKTNLVQLLFESGATQSKSFARRVIAQGGVRVNDTKVEDIDAEVDTSDTIHIGKHWTIEDGKCTRRPTP